MGNAERTLGFLADSRRMNVMLTRARRGVIVFGHGDSLRQSMDTGSHWRSWLEWAERKGAIISAANLVQGQPATAASLHSGSAAFNHSTPMEGAGSLFPGTSASEHHGIVAGFPQHATPPATPAAPLQN